MCSQVGPPTGVGKISRVGIALPFAPSSPPTTRILPLAMTIAVGYQRPCDVWHESQGSKKEELERACDRDALVASESLTNFPPSHSCR